MTDIKQKEFILRDKIINKIISQVKLPPFLKEEIIASLKYMNYYQLQKLWERMDSYIQELKEIIDHYHKQILYYLNKQLKWLS